MKKGKMPGILSILLLLVILAIAIPALPAQAGVALSISPTSGPQGTRVTVMGTPYGTATGLGPDQTVSLYLVSPLGLGSYEIEQFARNHDNDFFQGYFLVPPNTTVPPGTYNIELRPCPPGVPMPPCTLTALQLSSAITFTITAGTTTTTTSTATLTLTPDQGTPGTSVTINGTGFGPGAMAHVYIGSIDTGIVRTVSAAGTFTATLSMTLSEPGTYNIKAEDDSSPPISASADFLVLKELKAFVGKNNGAVGTNETVAGTGFKPNTAITIKYDDTDVSGGKVTSDGTGSFQTSFKIPTSLGGDHKITITDGTNNKTFTFTMETTPPPIPPLTGPAMNTTVDGPLLLNWQAVTDDSMPVTYNIQIASDPSFEQSTVVLEKKGVKEVRWALSISEQDKLTPTASVTNPQPTAKKYYWSVQAIDAASNKSDWAPAGAFIIPAAKSTAQPTSPTTPASPTSPAAPTTPKTPGTGTNFPGNLPGWAIYALAGLGALLFLFIGILIGRRSAYY